MTEPFWQSELGRAIQAYLGRPNAATLMKVQQCLPPNQDQAASIMALVEYGVESRGKAEHERQEIRKSIEQLGRRSLIDAEGIREIMKHKDWIVGMICLLTTIGLGVWGFSLGTLTEDQRRILVWAMPLASGFACGAFAGRISVKADGVVPRAVIGATGGFAVWLITFFFLFPKQ